MHIKCRADKLEDDVEGKLEQECRKLTLHFINLVVEKYYLKQGDREIGDTVL